MSIPLFKFKIFGGYEDAVLYGISMRDGGVSDGPLASLNLGLAVGDKPSNIEENYRRVCEAIGVPMDKLCIAIQEHTDKVLRVNDGGGFEHPYKGVDGFVTNVPGIPLMVRFADCQGILLFDPVKRVIGAVHSGWRGNAQDIIGEAVRKMVDEYECNPADILAGVSPSLGPCCAEFSDPLTELPEHMHKYIDGTHVDLWECASDQLKNAGVLSEHIEIARECTVCNREKYFSFRGGKKITGHMGGVIQLI